MAAKGPASAAAGTGEQQELRDGELAALKLLLEGAVLCNDSHLSVVTDEATGGLVRWNGTMCGNASCMCRFSCPASCICWAVQRQLVVCRHCMCLVCKSTGPCQVG
jgi:hypothetical protein